MSQEINYGFTKIEELSNSALNFQMMRLLSVSRGEGSAIGECFYVVNRLNKLTTVTPLAWTNEFLELAEAVENRGNVALKNKHLISARDYYLRASQYYRSAEYYADPDTNRRELGLKSRAVFIQAMKLYPTPVEIFEIPYEDGNMPAYFFKVDDTNKARKTLMVINGSDGTAEELYFFVVQSGLERGYNVLVFDGPGQVGHQRLYPNSHFRYDYEVPIGSAIDYLHSRLDVNKTQISLIGYSFGGYFATRVACFETRLCAVILDSPSVECKTFLSAKVKPVLTVMNRDILVSELGSLPSNVMTLFEQIEMKSFCQRCGVDTLGGLIPFSEPFHVTKSDLARVTIPSLALSSIGEGAILKAQAQIYRERVKGSVTAYEFTAKDGADSHCQVGNFAIHCAVVYDWLDSL